MSFWSFLSGALDPIAKIIDDVTTNDEERINAKAKLLEVQNILSSKLLEYESRLIESQSRIIIAEAQGQSWLQRNWRPMLMVTFMAILVNNYIIVPYATAFGAAVPTLEIPGGMWALLTVGVGGYVGGRSLEKIKNARI